MKLLLHCCCAPCSAGCLPVLRRQGLETTLYWYNPNIHLYTEYKSRRDSLTAFAADEKVELALEDKYGLRDFLSSVPSEAGSCRVQRCAHCYRLRLEKTALAARENGCSAFSTTLLISPYQDHEAIVNTGREISARCNIEFFYRDFRPFYREGRRTARERGYYSQKYCGCVFSEEERYLS